MKKKKVFTFREFVRFLDTRKYTKFTYRFADQEQYLKQLDTDMALVFRDIRTDGWIINRITLFTDIPAKDNYIAFNRVTRATVETDKGYDRITLHCANGSTHTIIAWLFVPLPF